MAKHYVVTNTVLLSKNSECHSCFVWLQICLTGDDLSRHNVFTGLSNSNGQIPRL